MRIDVGDSGLVVERIVDIDWLVWQPTEVAALTFVIRQQQILLIRKLRGLGAGKLNGPGGRLQANETLSECAVREVEFISI